MTSSSSSEGHKSRSSSSDSSSSNPSKIPVSCSLRSMDSEVMKIQDKLVFPPNVPVSIQIIEIFENLFKTLIYLTQVKEKYTCFRPVYYYVFAVFTTLFYSKLRPTFEPDYSTLEQTSFFQNSFVQKRTYCD